MEKIKELNVTELEQVTGGNGLCASIGGSDGCDAAICLYYGAGTNDTNRGIGFTLCIFAGFGFGFTGTASEA